MRRSESVNLLLLFMFVNLTVFVSSQDVVKQNGTKVVGLQDPSVDATVKSALENGTVSEVVVRKDLLLFPVNAPNLVIAHRQEIHAIPQNNSNNNDGKPSSAEVAEVNEYSLSQVLSNDTDYNNETESQSIPNSEFTPVPGPQNDQVLEPGKLLEVPSGFNFSDGLATEKVALPDEIQNLTLPKQSIVDLLSKSLARADSSVTGTPKTYKVWKRSVDTETTTETNEDTDTTTESATNNQDDYSNIDLMRRSVNAADDSSSSAESSSDSSVELDKQADMSDEDSKDESDSTEDGTSTSTVRDGDDTSTDSRSFDASDNTDVVKRSDDSTTDSVTSDVTESTEVVKRSLDSSTDSSADVTNTEPNDGSTEGSKVVKRSIDVNYDDEDDSDSSTTTEYNDREVRSSLKKLTSTTNDSDEQNNYFSSENESLNDISVDKKYVKDDTEEDMDVAEDIVFRPLFRYRQETELKQRYSPYRRSNYDSQNSYRYRADDYD